MTTAPALSPLAIGLLLRCGGSRTALGDALDAHTRGSVTRAQDEVFDAGLITRDFQLTKAGRDVVAAMGHEGARK